MEFTRAAKNPFRNDERLWKAFLLRDFNVKPLEIFPMFSENLYREIMLMLKTTDSTDSTDRQSIGTAAIHTYISGLADSCDAAGFARFLLHHRHQLAAKFPHMLMDSEPVVRLYRETVRYTGFSPVRLGKLYNNYVTTDKWSIKHIFMHVGPYKANEPELNALNSRIVHYKNLIKMILSAEIPDAELEIQCRYYVARLIAWDYSKHPHKVLIKNITNAVCNAYIIYLDRPKIRTVRDPQIEINLMTDAPN